jgi:hypothetical protein
MPQRFAAFFVSNEKAPEGAVGYYFGYYSHFFKALTRAAVARLLPSLKQCEYIFKVVEV